jgi:phosphoenolpyruvate-protein kinase (PTS system EI component)
LFKYAIRNWLAVPILLRDPPTCLCAEVIRESGDTPVSLCGELAGRIDLIPSLLRAGLRSFSVPATLPDVKEAIKQANAC